MSGLIAMPAALENWLWLARAAALLTAMLCLALALRHWRRSQERDAQRMFEQLDLLRTELLLLQERIDQAPAVTVQHVAPAPVVNVERSTPIPNSMSFAPAPRGYEVAARLARSGATIDELVSSCGLSRHEAQLLQRLHGNAEKSDAHAAVTQRTTTQPSTPSTNTRPAARVATPAPNKATAPTRRVEPRLGERVPERPAVRSPSRLATAV